MPTGNLAGSQALTDEEFKCLSIPKALTNEERKIMESHVTVGQRMLEKIALTAAIKMYQPRP